MRVLVFAAIVALFLVPPSATPVEASVSSPYSSVGSHPIAPGVARDWGNIVVDKGRQAVNIVEVDPAQSGIHFRTSLAADRVTARQRTTTQALNYSREGRRVVATINGSTFGSWPMGHVAARGLNVRDREVLTAGRIAAQLGGPILAFAVDSANRPMIGMPSLDIEVSLPGGRVSRVDRINQGRLTDETVLFTPRFDTRTWTDDQGDEYIIGGFDLPIRATGTYSGKVLQARRGLGNSTIGAGQVVLSATGAGAHHFSTLAVGDDITISLAIEPGWEDIVHAVGGRELLVRNGAMEIVPYRPSVVYAYHPRTAVGIRADGRVILVTVDGRSTDSGSVSMPELAQLLIERGAVTALNLDGGGSTTLAVRRPGDLEVGIVNTPSDGTERTVATTLQIISSVPTGSLAALAVSPREAALGVGQTQQYQVKGHDAAYNGIVVNTAKLNWTVTNDAATVDGNALLTAQKAGQHTATARTQGVDDTVSITVQADTNLPVVTPPDVRFREGVNTTKTQARLSIGWTATDDEGGIKLIELQRRADGGSWKSLSLSSPTATSANNRIRFGRTVQYRVRATDQAGNRSAWSVGRTMRVVLHDERSPSMLRTGEWLQRAKTQAINDQFGRSRTVGASMSLTAQGVQIAWIGVRTPKGGPADVFLSNVNVGRLSTYNGSALHRRVLYVSPLADVSAPMPTLSLRVVNAGTASRPRADVDAYLVLVTAD